MHVAIHSVNVVWSVAKILQTHVCVQVCNVAVYLYTYAWLYRL